MIQHVKRKKSHVTIYEVCQALKKIVLVSWESTFIFNFSDWWNQAACGFILVDLVSHVGTHGLDLNVSGIGIIRFICKPFLFSVCLGTPGTWAGSVGLPWMGWSGRRSSSC